MFRTVCSFILAILCFAYILFVGAFIGLAHDYVVIGYGLAPIAAYPAAILCAVLAFMCFRLAFHLINDEDEPIEDMPFANLDHLPKE